MLAIFRVRRRNNCQEERKGITLFVYDLSIINQQRSQYKGDVLRVVA